MSAFFVRKGTSCILLKKKEIQAEWSGLWLNFNLPLQAKSYNDVSEVWGCKILGRGWG
jgi:hypothetical protein